MLGVQPEEANSTEQVDDEPSYVHTVAPDPRRLEALKNPVSST